jgi:glutamate transport system ATP-binding protein
MTGTTLVQLTDVNKHFGDLHVLRDINLEVAKGEVVVVIGPSGSGKSTLCRAINRLEPIDSGTITIDGKELPEEGSALAALRADVGMVFQSFNLFAHMSILGNVMLGPVKVRKVPKAKAKERAMSLLERVGVADQAGKYPAQLSGGQQQRVAIAQAIVDDAELLLLDEPLANLDLRNQQEIVRLLGDLHRERDVTIMVVAHDLNPLLPVLTDAIYLLDGHPHHDEIGEVVQEELLTHLYGTPVGVVRTAQGDLFTRAAWRDHSR